MPQLTVGTFGDEVSELHERLREDGFDIAPSERHRRFFGPSTREAVRQFQLKHRLPMTAVVDETTRATITDVGPSAARGRRIEATAGRLDALGRSNGPVDRAAPAALLPVVPRPTQPATPVSPPASPNPPAGPPGDVPKEFQFLVRGQVVYLDGLPIPGLVVRAFNKELRREDLLGEAPTDTTGNFEIWYSEQQLPRPDQRYADLIVRAYSPPDPADPTTGEQLLAESPVIYAAQTVEKVRLLVDGGVARTWSEYDQLVTELQPALEGLALTDLVEREGTEDISLLSGKTGQDTSRIAMLVTAHKLAARTGIAPEVFYGLARQSMSTNLSEMLAQNPDVRQRAIERAIGSHLIPGRLATEVTKIQEQFRAGIAGYVGTNGQNRALGGVLELALPDAGQRALFLTKYAGHTGSTATLWKELSETPELKDRVPDLQLTLQMATLTGNHVPLVTTLRRLREQGQFSTFRDLARLGPAEWKQIISTQDVPEDQRVPPEIPGATAEDKAWTYAATMARVLEDVLPTEVIANRIRKDEARPAEMRALFTNISEHDTGLDLARGPLRNFVASHPELLAGVTNPELALIQGENVQRLFNLTTSYTEMRPLLDANLTPMTLAQMNPGTFINSFKSALGGEVRAKYLYEQASYSAAATMNLVANYSPAFNSVEMRVLQSPQASGVPNLEQLFGSLDLCQCAHCKSVYGPAAYYAEILAFLAERAQALTQPNGSKIAGTARDVLFARRPDLGDIELTCENTNTPLPYVDLVNEILEEAIAPFVPFTLDASLEATLDARVVSNALRDAFTARNRTLSADAVIVIAGVDGNSWFITDHAVLYAINQPTSGVITVASVGRQTKGKPKELGANPEHVNAAAYERLRTAIFPWTLPLNLWWEEARVYLDHLKVPRHELMREFDPQGPPANQTNVAVASEQLGLTTIERQLLTGGGKVRVASTAAIATPSGLVTVDGVTLTDGDQILVKDQADATANGVYTAAAGAWAKASPPAGATAFLSVQQGTANTGTLWIVQTGSDGTVQATTVRPWNFWGLQETGNPVRTFDPATDDYVTSSLGWRDALTHVRELLKRSRLSYEELNQLLAAEYVAAGTPIRIESADPEDPTTCDTSKLVINPLTTQALNRARTFVRLWRRLGWTIPEVDRAISVLSAGIADVNARIDDGLIVKLSHVARLTSALALSVEEILTFWSAVDTRGPDSLYLRLFQNPTVIRPVDPAFALAGNELAILSSSPSDATLSTHVPTIVAALGVTAPELALLLSTAVSDDILNLANLSTLYRHTLLARGLSLPIADLIALRDLSGVALFDPARTENAVMFVELADRVKASGFSIAELDYLLRHRASDAVDVAPGDEAVALVLTEMRGGLLKIQDETRRQPDPEGELLRKKLALLRWHPDAIDQAVAHLAGLLTYKAPLAALPAGFVMPPELETRVTHTATAGGTLEVAGPLTGDDRQKLWDASSDSTYRAAVTQIVEVPRRFAADQMKLFAWPTFSADLAALPAGYAFANELRGRIFFDARAQKLRFAGSMTASERTLLLQSTTDVPLKTAVQTLFDAAVAYVPESRNAFLSSADITDVFDRPAASERIDRVLVKLLGYLRRTLSAGLVTQSLSDALGLDAKAIDQLITRTVNALSVPGEPAVADFLTPAFAESHPSVMVTPTEFPRQFEMYRRLDKVAQVTRKLSLTARQLEWLSLYGPAVPLRQAPWLSGATLQTRWLDLNLLPTATVADGRSLFAALMRMVELRRVRDYFRRGENALAEILAIAHSTGLSPAALSTAIVDKVAERSGWSTDELTLLIGASGLNLTVPDDFRDEYGLSRLIACFRRLRRTGAAALQCMAWSRPELTAADARAIRQVVKAKYSEDSWLEVAKPLRDELRGRQRRALVDYLAPRADPSKQQFWTDADGLYAHYLIDVQMEPCFMTSRLKQAISSVQLFVQRSLMNLEREIAADDTVDPGWRDWGRWMKAYRIWEANRKVFLYPENWIEPELRDDKTPFFLDLENELLQGDVTVEAAEDALLSYLEKLDAVARLEIAGMFYQDPAEGNPGILHVFGRTQGTAPTYYYRQRLSTGRWSHWERMDVDITEEQIIPIVWNRRLFLFWPVFTEVLVPKSPIPDKPEPGNKYFDIQLAWSERKHSRWTTKKVTTQTIRSNKRPDEGRADHGKGLHTFRAAVEGAGLKIWYEYDDPEHTVTIPIAPYYGGGTRTLHWADVQGFHFTGCDGQVQIFIRRINGIYQPTGTIVDSMMFSEASSAPLRLPESSSGEGVGLQATPGQFRLLYPHQDSAITGNRVFFFQDDQKTYFVSPREIDVIYWIWKNPDYVEPFHIDLLKRYYYEIQQPDPIGPVMVGADRVLPIEVAMNTVRAMASTPVAMAMTAGEGAVTGTGTAVAVHAATAAPAAGTTVFDAQPGIGAFEYQPKWMLAKGEKELIKVSDYIADDRIFRPVRWIPISKREKRYTFEAFYHPYVCKFVKELKRSGLDAFFARTLQLTRLEYFKGRYGPTALIEKGDPAKEDKYPVEDVDFVRTGAYSQYNWELFFHVPMLIATKLSQNQRFEDAQKWFHYIFDPTDTSDTVVPRKYWRTRPFYEHTQADYLKQRIDRLLELLAKGEPDPELDQQVAEYRLNPFKPHAVARLRPVAYQKAVVIKYLDNLIAWGDQLFRRDTIESINEATQLYVLAAEILGPRPIMMPPRAEPQVQTYNSLDPLLRQLANRFVPIEFLVPPPRPDGVVIPADHPPLLVPKMLYFCVPPNDKLLSYWDTVADRLFKIRHCMNIEGVVRQLALFEPPIDPALLVKAAAAGMDLSSALNDINAPAPRYRFNVIMRTASELCSELRSLGSSLLAALEKRDSEALAFTQARQESTLLGLVKDVREQQVEEATQNLVALRSARAGAVSRYVHFQKLLGVQSPRVPAEGETIPEQSPSPNAAISDDSGVKLIAQEKTELTKLKASNEDQAEAADEEHSAAIANIFPSIGINVTPWWIGLNTSFGGPNIGAAHSASASKARASSAQNTYESGRASRLGMFIFREHDWVGQSNTAAHEIMHLDQQIAAAEIQEAIAKNESRNHEQQQEHAREVEEFLRDKYTNRELYSWMVGQISAMYFQAYQFTYDVAKRAERAYRFELGLQDSNFIQFGYWDSLRKGLLAGDRLYHDLKRMEVAYLDQNRREHEMTKHISLTLLHPEALVELRQTGSCFVELPEALFDIDCPGHYMRRLKSVSVSIPCVTGPYTSVTCRLTLLGNRTRRDTRTTPSYGWTGFEDSRFAYNGGGIESVVTSSAREDSGLFELNFGDERYLPFEGSGAISGWRIELPDDFRQFDYNTITDVVLHVRYTARDGGELLRREAGKQLATALKQMELDEGSTGLFRGFTMRQDFSADWNRFLYPAGTAPNRLALTLDADRFPTFVRNRNIRIDRLIVFIRLKAGLAYDENDPLTLTILGPTGGSKLVELQPTETAVGGLPSGTAEYGAGVAISATTPWQVDIDNLPAALRKTVEVNGQPVDRLDPEAIQDLGLVLHYTF
jgi:peptidoglycan hydrolase-like protein with peptidoglycan-binding domain